MDDEDAVAFVDALTNQVTVRIESNELRNKGALEIEAVIRHKFRVRGISLGWWPYYPGPGGTRIGGGRLWITHPNYYVTEVVWKP